MPYKVTLQPSGHAFEVAEDQTILRAGLDAGYSMPYSCRQGVCRTCRGTIRAGQVDYGDVHPTYLPESDKAQGYALLCQAKPLSDLIIEVKELEGLAGIRVRVVDYSPGYVADHWCSKGHILYCLDGELTTDLTDGRSFTLKPGMSYQVADDADAHRSRTAKGARLFIVD